MAARPGPASRPIPGHFGRTPGARPRHRAGHMTRLICITLRWIGEPMNEQEGELGAAPGLATGDLTTEEGMAGQASRLGRQHRSAAIIPFGDVGHVYWNEGSAHL